MNIYKGRIQYKGTHFKGWQVQKNDNGFTIQGALNKALVKISKSESIRTIGSGRTDAGVHAFDQVVRIEIPLKLKEDALQRALNSNLPKDIYVKCISMCDDSFQPVFNAKEKEYHYYFSVSKEFCPFNREFVTSFPYDLDFSLMNMACNRFVGKHDFADFRCVGTDVKSTVREIYSCSIEKIDNGFFHPYSRQEVFVLKVRGNGFLKQMVRLIMGAVWNVGRGKVSLEKLSGSLSSPSGQKLSPVAPPEGLHLYHVTY